jgi:actin related protein 2/3 complex subunit 2
MLSLEPANRYLADTLTEKYVTSVPSLHSTPSRSLTLVLSSPRHHHSPSSLDQSFVDFDSVRYHLSTPNTKAKHQLLLSMDVPCWSELETYGARDVLEREYGSLLLDKGNTEDGYSVSLAIDLEQGPQAIGS